MDTTLLLVFATVSQTFALPDGLLKSLCYVESHHDVNAMHKDDGKGNSVGICQVKIETAKLLGFKGTEAQLRNPRTNIRYAGKYLAKQYLRYSRNTLKAVAAYNSGTYRENAQGQAKNKQYVKKVFTAWTEKK